MNSESNPIFDEIIDLIKSKLPDDSTLVYLSITGSRAKGITSLDSDYDTRSIILHPMKKYLLQKAKENTEIETSLKDGTKVEG